MNLSRWWRMRQARKRRSLITKLRLANRSLQYSYEGMRANQAYQPVCLGGVEDKYEGELEWQGRIHYWSCEVRHLARKLRLTREQAAIYR